jgi:hypothetical protein
MIICPDPIAGPDEQWARVAIDCDGAGVDIHVGPWEDEVTPEVVPRVEQSAAIETVDHRARGSS